MYECLGVQLTLLLLKHAIPVFVDHDNLLVEAQKLGAEYFNSDKDDKIRIKYRKLGDFIAGERTVESKESIYTGRPVRK
jgi:hypothetical protein